MQEKFKQRFIRPLLPYFILAVAILAAWKVINELSVFAEFVSTVWGIITPFFYGFLLAYVLNIPCGGIQKLLSKTKINFIVKRKKGFSVILVYIIFAFLVYWALSLVIPYIYDSVSLFIAQFPVYYDSAQQFLETINEWEFFSDYDINLDTLLISLRDFINSLSLDSLAEPLSAVVGVGSSLFRGFLALVTSIFILLEKEKTKTILRRMLRAFTSSATNSVILKYASKLNKNFKQYIFIQTIDGCILGTIVTIELFLFKSPYFLVLGIMLAILNYVPYFGSIFGSLIAIGVVTFTQGLTTGAIAAVVLIVTQQLDGNVIQPKLMGESFKMSPLLIIISITIGGAFAGILGMIAAIPIVAVLKDITENIIAHYEKRKIALESMNGAMSETINIEFSTEIKEGIKEEVKEEKKKQIIRKKSKKNNDVEE